MIPDLIGSLVSLLKGTPEVNNLVSGRIYGGEIPRNIVGQLVNQQAKLVVIQTVPGGFGDLQRTFVPAGNNRIDTRCYGETLGQAMEVHRAVYPTFKQFRRRLVGATLLFDITPIADAALLRDPDANDWPYVIASYNVLAAEES